MEVIISFMRGTRGDHWLSIRYVPRAPIKTPIFPATPSPEII